MLPVQKFDSRVFGALGITARAGYSPALSQAVQPVIALPLDALTRRVIRVIDQAAGGAGQRASIQLMNPANSGILLSVKSFRGYHNAAAAANINVSMGASGASLGGAPVNLFEARILPIVQGSSLVTAYLAGAAAAASVARSAPIAANVEWEWKPNLFELLPDSSIVIQVGAGTAGIFGVLEAEESPYP